MTTVTVFIDWFWPGYKAGGPIRSVYNIIKSLETNDTLSFKLITRDTDYMESTKYEHVTSDEWNRISPNLSVYYFSKKQLTFANFIKTVKETQADIFYITGIWSFWFSILPLLLKAKTKTIIAPRGMLAGSAVAIKSFRKNLYLSLANKVGLYKKITFHFTNELEHNFSKTLVNFTKAYVINNISLQNSFTEKRPVSKEINQIRLIFLGRVAPEKNTLFAINSLQTILDFHIVLDIYGSSYDKAYTNECIAAINKLPQNVSVNLMGSRSHHKIPTILTNYHYMYLPSRGENYGHAIAESFLAGIPVIISDQTPWSYIQNCGGVGEVLPLWEPYRFTKAIEILAAEDFNTYYKRRQAVNKFAKKKFPDPELVKKYAELFSC